MPDFDAGGIRVIIIGDRPIARIGLQSLLAGASDVRVVGGAGDRASAIMLAKALCPDVALVDVSSPKGRGIEIAQAILAVNPTTRVALISGAFDDDTIDRGIEFGIRGFILKTASPDQLTAIIREISRGEFYSSEGTSPDSAPIPEDRIASAPGDSRLQLLKPRERAMLIELAKGASLKQAARTIGITYKAADHLKQKVMKKLDLHDRVEIARFAIREGLLS